MISRRTTAATLASLLGLIASGCVGDRAHLATSAQLAASKDMAESTADDEISAMSPGKPLPPIDVHYTIVGVPTVGQPLEIQLRSGGRRASAALDLALSGSERLQVPVEAARLRFAFAAVNERRIETIRVTPLAPGRHYLSVLAQAQIGGRVRARSVTIPIDVGAEPVAAPRPATVSVDAAGERIVSLPARR
jgi:hypothetical protein